MVMIFFGDASGKYRVVDARATRGFDYPPRSNYFVAELEQFEDRILHAFQHAAQKSEDAGVRTIAQRYMPEVSRDHAQMRDLKHAKAA